MEMRLGAMVCALVGLAALDPLLGAAGMAPGIVRPAAAEFKLKALLDRWRGEKLPDTIASSNGRIEGQEIEVSAKYTGRLAEMMVEEGDMVEAGEVIARLDDRESRAQLLGAQADELRAESALAEAEALIAQRDSELEVAEASYNRIVELFHSGHVSAQTRDERRGALRTAEAARRAADAQKAQAVSSIEAAKAEVSRLQAILDDMVITAPRRGRVQYKLARAGEVVAAGARIVTLLDLTDVSMSLYLPADQAGKVAIGDEARIILDPVPQYVVPARVTFVSADAQFTPKAVETKDEREKLVFRVKIQIPRALLQRFERQVKVGVRGIGYVRTDPSAPWPPALTVNLPQ
ncbi:HlyD family secretion protein [Aurantimonas sp. VKM B-3413]|uniref:HlyD family secretion protein n=1 Tax=Aurantimonas sp. VKM B-3413 TaxID=2779401 RepID=UPI001E60EB2C|nr:HlyD family efflux transporter periplasmic adaptor subunit [Aurantimonas sp. VKM B-3413]MCB8839903.1 HlyD family efflux transporter periplasmic adaptor subunit [Aurantimonas sp. VKM B-3413]